ncbi:hypothetical protein LTR85_009705 [Meristemomyces frigidus]|nr:hypothetical protein LTR85_009705 [Meristemomyces frigidus]
MESYGVDDNLDAREMQYPCWVDEPRGFIDMATRSADDLHSFLSAHLSFAVESWALSQRRWVFRFQDLSIELVHDAGQPLSISANSESMPRKYLDALRADLRSALKRALGDFDWSTLGFGVMLLQTAESAEGWLQHWRSVLVPTKKIKVPRRETDFDYWDDDAGPRPKYAQALPGNEGWDAASATSWTRVLENDNGLNLLTVEDTAKHLLGQSIAEICQDFPAFMRILHVEPVFRNDLVMRFTTRQHEILKELSQLSYAQLRKCISGRDMHARRISNTTEALAKALSQPSVTFHGAPRRAVSSIVRYGFILPGQKIGSNGEILDIRCGSSYGTGIYSSPDPAFASSYVDYGDINRNGAVLPSDIPGMRLLVCATLMGRPIRVSRAETRRTEGLFVKEAHAHVSPDGLEYVVFEPAQILPCYVLHVDYGAEDAIEEFYNMPRNPCDYRVKDVRDARKRTGYSTEDTSPAALLAKKRALKAAASKWFPYGFGPATGTSFVIEEIGEVSDDEEEYGEFQSARKEDGREIYSADQEKGGSWFDEYQTVRKSNKELRPVS